MAASNLLQRHPQRFHTQADGVRRGTLRHVIRVGSSWRAFDVRSCAWLVLSLYE